MSNDDISFSQDNGTENEHVTSNEPADEQHVEEHDQHEVEHHTQDEDDPNFSIASQINNNADEPPEEHNPDEQVAQPQELTNPDQANLDAENAREVTGPTDASHATGGEEEEEEEELAKPMALFPVDSKKITEDSEIAEEAEEESVPDSESGDEAIKPKEKPKKVIDPDYLYDLQLIVSKPYVTEDSGIPSDLVTLVHSFGFDALRRNNLNLLENDVICYVAGNYLEILNLTTTEKQYIRSVSGVGIGAFAVHPDRTVIALAEKGDWPYVCIYLYPRMDLYRVLVEGTQKEYAACEFSPDGEMLAVVGSDPDYMLTLWEWRNEQIVLRAKAFSQDIFRVAWSADLAGILTTAGVGHIRFWKMADTFTGLKLQGKLGKFGKTELSDIEGFVTLPDGKVLTGSSWGNLLVWEGDLIKVQISRKNKRPCHTGLIMQIVMDEGELMTVGQDGWIRTWDFETVDTAECLEEGAIFELEPMNELQVRPSAKLMYIVKVQEADTTMWYAQDGDGAIWKLDLSFSHTSLAPESLVKFHSDAITDCATSPFAYTAATIGRDGRICLYDLITKKSILRRRFPAGGSKLIWSPPQVDPKGKILVAGFEDGVVRVLQFGENPETDPTRKAKHFALLDVGQALKPHVKTVTTMAYNKHGDYFVTGSEDETIFFFTVHTKMLSPIGFVNVGGAVAKVEWIPSANDARGEVMVYLKLGCILKVPCPSPDEVDQSKSFVLSHIQPTGGFNVLSVKSKLLHDEDSAEKLRRYENEKKIRMELRKARAEREPETEEDAQKLDDEEELIRQGVMSEIADWAPSYPPKPSPILHAILDPYDPEQFWISMGDFDAGYLYKCRIGDPPVSAEQALAKALEEQAHEREVAGEDANEPKEPLTLQDMSVVNKRLTPTEPHAATKLDGQTAITYWRFSSSGRRVLIGLGDGSIRVQLLERPFDLESFAGYWAFRMHDNKRGSVNCIALSHDEKFLMSVGNDGTFFLCELMSEELQNKEIQEFRARIPSAYESQQPADDISDPKAHSIEQSKQKAEYDRLMNLAEQKKAETRKKVNELRLRFRRLKEQNDRLPERIRLNKEDFNLVPHIRADLLKDRTSKIDLVYRETAWMSEKYRLALEKLQNTFRNPLDFDRIVVRAFCTGHCVCSIRTNRLGEDHTEATNALQRIKAERMARAIHLDQRLSAIAVGVEDAKSDAHKAQSDGSQTQMKGARGLRIARQLHVLEEAQRRRKARRAQWDALHAMKPADDYEDPEDLKAIALAKERMGDFKLKSSQNYVVPDRATLNAFEAKCRLVNMIEEAFNLKHNFNQTVISLRDKKVKLIEELQRIDGQLERLQDDLPMKEPGLRLRVPDLRPEENPEKEFEYNRDILLRFKREREEQTSAQAENHNKAIAKPKEVNNLEQLDFSESICPHTIYDPAPTVLIESGANGSPREVIYLPVHLLGNDDYAVSLVRNYTNCGLQLPPPAGLTGTTIGARNPTDSEKRDADRPADVRVLQTTRDVRPQPISVSVGQPVPQEVVIPMSGERRAFRHVNSASSDPDTSGLLSQTEALEMTHSSDCDLRNLIMVPVTSGHTEMCLSEAEERVQRQMCAMYQRDELLTSAGRLVRCFDAEVRITRHARFQLDLLLKRAELHQLTLFTEFRLLKDFEKSELVLSERKRAKDDERQELYSKLAEFNSKIDSRKKELERLSQKEHQLHEEFKANLGEGHKFTDFLSRVFKKRIKRKKQEAADAGSDESDGSSSSDESSFDESEDESEDDENALDLDTCPIGCPIEDFENTCAIRERRLDVEDEMLEEKKQLDVLRKELEAYAKKQRIVDAGLKQAEAELEAFQLEKQRKLNELDAIVILRLNQIQYHVNGTVPADLSAGLVFVKQNLFMLHRRIVALEEEKKRQRREQKDAKDKHVMLQKHKKLFQKELEKISAICDKEMIEKFGKIDDIERMEGVVINPKLEELTTKMLLLQEEFEQKEAEMEEQIRAARDVCIEKMRQNTVYLSKMLMLFNEKESLQADLNKKQVSKANFVDNTDNSKAIKEVKRLMQLVRSQEEEINRLSKELGIAGRQTLLVNREELVSTRKQP